MTYAQMDGYLIPDLVLAEQEGQQIGKYRRMRKHIHILR